MFQIVAVRVGAVEIDAFGLERLGQLFFQLRLRGPAGSAGFLGSKQAEVTLTGGYLYPRLGVQLGPICERMLNSVSADLLIMGIGGVTASGISDSNSLIVESIRAMIRAARKVIIVADRSKFGRDSMIHVATLNDIDQIVSDKDLDPEFQEMLRSNEIDCILA
jgi:DeoR/GlpR family transcriptional regulator of sugar metabolism